MTVRPITDADASTVAQFLHEHLNSDVSPQAWSTLVSPPWKAESPNHGFLLLAGDALVGVYAAVYAERIIDGEVTRFCNLAAFCVLEDYRMHGLRLVRALLKQEGYVFTDLSPSGNVIAMNERLGFERLDNTTRLAVNFPTMRTGGLRISAEPHVLESALRGADATIYRDHKRAAAARHLLVQRGDEYAYLIFRVDTRKRMRLFASPLYAGGSRTLLQRAWPQIASHLLSRHGLPFTLAEQRVLGFTPRAGRELANPRPKMYRGAAIHDEHIDYLYSELALINW